MTTLSDSIKKYLWIPLFIVLAIIACTCENMDTKVNCNECYSGELDSADLIINASTESIINEVSVCVYNGIVNGENLIDCYDYGSAEYPLSNTYYFYVKTNSYYSVEAIYRLTDGKTVIVTDGDNMETDSVSGTCEYDCWTIKGGEVDVRLNFDLLPGLK